MTNDPDKELLLTAFTLLAQAPKSMDDDLFTNALSLLIAAICRFDDADKRAHAARFTLDKIEKLVNVNFDINKAMEQVKADTEALVEFIGELAVDAKTGLH